MPKITFVIQIPSIVWDPKVLTNYLMEQIPQYATYHLR